MYIHMNILFDFVRNYKKKSLGGDLFASGKALEGPFNAPPIIPSPWRERPTCYLKPPKRLRGSLDYRIRLASV
jgi:hypothetical protein